MGMRDTIDNMTAAEAIISKTTEYIYKDVPEKKGFHARSALFQINILVSGMLFRPSTEPYHHRVLTLATMFRQEVASKPYMDFYEKKVYENAANIAEDFYEAVMYHSNMEAPLPF